MTKLWVDPPSGWKYGFPKIWDGEGSQFDWLLAEGYPQKEIDSYGEFFFVRQWPVDQDDEDNIK
jgi:hypothetical protein